MIEINYPAGTTWTVQGKTITYLGNNWYDMGGRIQRMRPEDASKAKILKTLETAYGIGYGVYERTEEFKNFIVGSIVHHELHALIIKHNMPVFTDAQTGRIFSGAL